MEAPSIRRLVPRRVLFFLSVVGPGLIAAAAGDDAGGITTYSVAGARYGYRLLWVLFAITFVLAIFQEMCARMGAVTGKGLSDLIREEFGVRLTLAAMLALVVANTATTASEFAGVAASLEIVHVPRWVSVPLAAIGTWTLLVRGSYRRLEKILLTMSLVLLAYVVAGVIVRPDWPAVMKSLVVPSIQMDAPFLLLTVAVIGTTVAPWMQFYVQASVVDKGLSVRHLRSLRLDVLLGVVFTNVVAFFVIVTCAASLFPERAAIDTAEDAARALAPVAGEYARLLFGAGLLGASLLAGTVLPLSTAYAVTEALGFESGVDRSFREAPFFFGLVTALIAVGAAIVVLVPGSLVQIMLLAQDVNGLLLPVILGFVLVLAHRADVMGKWRTGPVYNAAGWAATGLLVILTGLLVVSSVRLL